MICFFLLKINEQCYKQSLAINMMTTMMMADITYRLKREEQRKETRMKENIDTHQEE